MISKERVWELMKQAGLDEKKYAELLAKEEPKLTADELDMVAGGITPDKVRENMERRYRLRDSFSFCQGLYQVR